MKVLTSEAVIRTVVMAALAIVPVVALAVHQPFYIDMMTRVMIYAIAALSLNLIVGFGGMVSFGHAAFLGLGAYVVGLAMVNGLTDGFAQFGLVVVVSAGFALIVGALSLRTGGLPFIMITLAFAQLLYFVGVALRQYGGDDGFTFRGRSVFPGLDLKDGVTFFYFVWVLLALFLAIVYRIVGSRFGMALRGIRSNERRIRALGLPSYRYKLAAFVIAGTMCGVAGGLLANFAQFVSPAYMHWGVSGDLLVMVLIGGFSSVFGPVIGAIVYRLLEDILSGYTEHWQIVLGPILILIVLFARKGLMGIFARRGAAAPTTATPNTGHG
jgi:branched-chain amino acid transport system permease protein